MRTLNTLCAALLCAVAHAEEPPTTSPIETQLSLPTEVQAATSALHDAAGYSSNVEYAGAIYSCARGEYHYTRAVRGQPTTFTMRISIPKDCELSALYHTHPIGAAPQRFSPKDVQEAKRLGVHSYVGDMDTGTVIILDRGHGDSDPHGVVGRVVGGL